MSVKVTLDKGRTKAKLTGRWRDSVLPVLTLQVIKDSNRYCKQDAGTLIGSSQIASDPGKGLAVWDTPYARRQYYTGRPSLDVNPDASLLWCDKAHDIHGREWDKLAQKEWDR